MTESLYQLFRDGETRNIISSGPLCGGGGGALWMVTTPVGISNYTVVAHRHVSGSLHRLKQLTQPQQQQLPTN